MTEEMTTTEETGIAKTDNGSALVAQDKLPMEMWTRTYALNSEHVGNPARVVGYPTVYKVCEYDGKRWAWIGIGEQIRLKVYQGSVLGKLLGIGWKDGKDNPVVTPCHPVVVDGILKELGDGIMTMYQARVAEWGGDVQAKCLTFVAGVAFEAQYTAARGDSQYLDGYMAAGHADEDIKPIAEKVEAVLKGLKGKKDESVVAALLGK